VALLEADRDQWRDPKSRGGGDGAAGAGASSASAGGERPGEADSLRTRLAASEERCRQLTAQAEGLAAEGAQAAEAVKAAKLEAAAAKEAAANAEALSRHASAPPPAAESLPDISGTGREGGQEGGQEGVPAGTKVLHMRANPAHNAQQMLIDGLRARVGALKMKLEVAEAAAAACSEGGEGGSKDALVAAAAATSLLEAQTKCEELRKENVNLETKVKRFQSIFQDKIREFRETAQALTGYRIDQPMQGNKYDLYPPYVPRDATTVLSFRCDKQGQMELLNTEFAQQLGEQMETYLRERHSIPAFLAATTIKLFDRSCGR
jgi:hypothetical protein